MRAEKLRELDENELQAQVRDISEQMFRLRFQLGMGQMDSLKKYRVLKKDKARILTVLREREIETAAEAQEKEGS
jgi:large subunit ribosomal protein L29